MTVGTGISPVREHALFADFTAGGELHSAPKNIRLPALYALFIRLSSIFICHTFIKSCFYRKILSVTIFSTEAVKAPIIVISSANLTALSSSVFSAIGYILPVILTL